MSRCPVRKAQRAVWGFPPIGDPCAIGADTGSGVREQPVSLASARQGRGVSQVVGRSRAWASGDAMGSGGVRRRHGGVSVAAIDPSWTASPTQASAAASPQHQSLPWPAPVRCCASHHSMISSKGPRRCGGNFSGSNGGLTGFATVALSVVVARRGCRYGAAAMAARSCSSVGFCPLNSGSPAWRSATPTSGSASGNRAPVRAAAPGLVEGLQGQRECNWPGPSLGAGVLAQLGHVSAVRPSNHPNNPDNPTAIR